MTDLSCVGACHTMAEIEEMARLAAAWQVKAVYAMPSFTKQLVSLMQGTGVTVGGLVGFPSGADTAAIKLMTAEELLMSDCRELDMVINQGYLKSGMDAEISREIRNIVAIADKVPVKVILEVNNLTGAEIVRGAMLAAEAGCAHVKTGTGWHHLPTTVDHVRLIHEAVGNAAGIKAAGGIRTLETAYEMYLAGCRRFGIGTASFRKMICNGGHPEEEYHGM